jgi:hypothetical protein
VIDAPPSFAGTVNATETVVLPRVAVPIVGASGTVAGVTLFDAADKAPSPIAFVARTLHVTAVPFVKPVTTIGDAVPETLCVPHVAVNPVIAEPPVLAGPVNAIDTVVLPRVAVPIVGAPGTVAGVTLFDAADDAPLPFTFVARTVQVTAVPFVRPVTVIGEAVPVALRDPHVAR